MPRCVLAKFMAWCCVYQFQGENVMQQKFRIVSSADPSELSYPLRAYFIMQVVIGLCVVVVLFGLKVVSVAIGGLAFLRVGYELRSRGVS